METFNEFPREIDFFLSQGNSIAKNKKKFDIKIKYHSKIRGNNCLIFSKNTIMPRKHGLHSINATKVN